MFLDSIVANRLDEIQLRQETVPLSELKVAIKGKSLPLDLATVVKPCWRTSRF